MSAGPIANVNLPVVSQPSPVDFDPKPLVRVENTAQSADDSYSAGGDAPARHSDRHEGEDRGQDEPAEQGDAETAGETTSDASAGIAISLFA